MTVLHKFFANKIATVLIMLPSLAFAHGGESRIEIELETASIIQAGNQAIEFQLVDTKQSKTVGPKDLKVSHEKLLHVLFYDSALKEFRHVHPTFNGQVWQTEIDSTVNGFYFLWVQGKLSSDGTEFSSFTRIEVTGGQRAWPTPPSLLETRAGSDGTSTATLSNEQIRAGRSTMLKLAFGRNDGSTAVITPYLGAFAHIIAVPADDGDSLIHVHPMNGRQTNEGMLHATFPTAGLYRIWIQFLDNGLLKTVPLVVDAK